METKQRSHAGLMQPQKCLLFIDPGLGFMRVTGCRGGATVAGTINKLEDCKSVGSNNTHCVHGSARFKGWGWGGGGGLNAALILGTVFFL